LTARVDSVVAIVDPVTGNPDTTVAVVGSMVVDIEGATAGQVLTVQPDGSVAAEYITDLDAMEFKGVINCSTNPNYPAASAGNVYRVSVAGKIGGGSGVNVEVGDTLLAIADNAGGTQAAVGTSWSIEQANIDGAVIGPASATADRFATFDGVTGKLIKDSGLALDTDGTLAANSDVKLASQKAVKTYADTKVAASLFDANTILAATTDDTPAALTVGASTIIGRKATGGIAALSPSEAITVITGGQIAGNTDLLAGLVTQGLRAASSNPPLDLGTGAVKGGSFQSPSGTALTVGTAGNNSMLLATNGSTRVTIANTGGVSLADAVNLAVGTGTGTKIGTATTQKISLWNATPIVQPTTAVAAATFVANTSLIANDSATWDGYTIGQVVKALRNIGALA